MFDARSMVSRMHIQDVFYSEVALASRNENQKLA